MLFVSPSPTLPRMLCSMAKRRSTSTAIVRAVPVPVRTPAPVIRIATPRPLAAPKKKHRRSSSVGGGLTEKTLFGAGIGGLAIGFIEKQFPNLPLVPVLGRKGTIAIGAYLLSKRGGMGGGIMRDVALAASVLSGYELGKTGQVTGDVMGEDYDDVSGLAAQV